MHLLGGPESVERMLPMTYNQSSLANQRFYLVDGETAFEITAFPNLDPGNEYGCQLRRLLALSSLKRLHWVNIGLHSVSLQTLAD